MVLAGTTRCFAQPEVDTAPVGTLVSDSGGSVLDSGQSSKAVAPRDCGFATFSLKVAQYFLGSHTKISGSAGFSMMVAIFAGLRLTSAAFKRAGSFFCNSIVLTKGSGDARETNEAVHREGRTGKHAKRREDLPMFAHEHGMDVRYVVASSANSTSVVVWTRLVRKACGANFINQSLYLSTDLMMSAFHC